MRATLQRLMSAAIRQLAAHCGPWPRLQDAALRPIFAAIHSLCSILLSETSVSERTCRSISQPQGPLGFFATAVRCTSRRNAGFRSTADYAPSRLNKRTPGTAGCIAPKSFVAMEKLDQPTKSYHLDLRRQSTWGMSAKVKRIAELESSIPLRRVKSNGTRTL